MDNKFKTTVMIPKDLHYEIKLICVEQQTTMLEWMTSVLTDAVKQRKGKVDKLEEVA